MSPRPNPGHLPAVTEILEQESGAGDFADYYPRSAAGELSEADGDPYFGRNVIWLGEEGRMLRADPDYVQHIWGNLFDADKLAAVVSGIDEAPDRVWFIAPYGTASRIDLQAVRESQDYAEDEGLDRPYTTGDVELDRFLTHPDEVLDDYGGEGEPEREDARAELEARLDDAVWRGEGDLGEWVVTIRDGNHRAFGALLAGEPYVYVMLTDNELQDLKQAEKAGKLSDEQRELLELLE